MQQIAKVTSVTRKYVEILINGSKQLARVSSRKLEPAVGDSVHFHFEGEDCLVDSILERKNVFRREFGRKTKLLASNVDLVLILTAPDALFNTVAIDRIATTAHCEGITSAVVLNKTDLLDEKQSADNYLKRYSDVNLQTFAVSVHQGLNLAPLETFIRNPDHSVVVLTGVSGVGKSSLLSHLLGSEFIKVGEVSEKTGQGRQTTSQAFGYRDPVRKESPLLLVDLPGIQQFGVSHLSEEEIRLSFPEFESRYQQCKYANCSHRNEPECAIIEALSEGQIALSRYNSYLGMLEEIEQNREF